MDFEKHNRQAWDREVERRNRWTLPVTAEQVAAARRGEWSVQLTSTLPVPRDWFGDVSGASVLCLASGGGQQGPILAAAGADVTVIDNSPRQLAQDRHVAERDSLDMRIELGSMIDLSRFDDRSFDLVFHPVSNVFIPDVLPVWREASRVLRPHGRLLAGFANPLLYLFDEQEEARGELIVRHKLPYSDLESLSPGQLAARLSSGETLQFGHSLEHQIGGQIEAGFSITGFYEDIDPESPLSRFTPLYIATLAVKTQHG